MSAEGEVPTNAPEHCPGTQSENAGKASACEGCPNQQICASGQAKIPDPDLPKIAERMRAIKHKILVLSGKGGVGKSTLTKELGLALGRFGFIVGLIDADLCGPSLPRLLGVMDEEVHRNNNGIEPVLAEENVSVVSVGFLHHQRQDAFIGRAPEKNSVLKDFLMSVDWEERDCILIDTPPGTSDEHLSLLSFLRGSGIDGAVVVTTPQKVALADVRKELAFCKAAKLPVLGLVENMSGFVCPNCHNQTEIFAPREREGKRGGEKLAEEWGIPFLGRVPLDPSLMISCEDGMALETYAQKQAEGRAEAPTRSPAIDALESIAKQLVNITDMEKDRLPVPMQEE